MPAEDDSPLDPNVTRLEAAVRRQRVALGCLAAALVAVILFVVGALIFGYQVLEFLRALGRGHPG